MKRGENSKHNFILFLLCSTIFISIILIVRTRYKDNFINRNPYTIYDTIDINPHAREYLNKNPHKIRLNKKDYNDVMNYYFDRPIGMSWEGSARLNSPAGQAIRERIYRRDCPIPLISQMGKYDPLIPDMDKGVMPREFDRT